MNYDELLNANNALREENVLLKAENERLRRQLNLQPSVASDNLETADTLPGIIITDPPKISNSSSPQEKVKLFMSVFRGREDVYANPSYAEAS